MKALLNNKRDVATLTKRLQEEDFLVSKTTLTPEEFPAVVVYEPDDRWLTVTFVYKSDFGS